MPTRPFRILSRNLYQRMGASAAWDRAIEVVRKSGGGGSRVLIRTLRNAREEHLAAIRADTRREHDLVDVELSPELDTKIDSMTKQADMEVAQMKRGRKQISKPASVRRMGGDNPQHRASRPDK